MADHDEFNKIASQFSAEQDRSSSKATEWATWILVLTTAGCTAAMLIALTTALIFWIV